MFERIIKYFENNELPKVEVFLLDGVSVKPENAKIFIENTIALLKKQTGNLRYLPYYENLKVYYLKTIELNKKKK